MEGPLRPPADPGFCLIETCLWAPESGVQRRALHLERLAQTATRLGIVPYGVEDALDSVTGDAPLRLRLTVDAGGKAEVACHPFHPVQKGTIWNLKLSETRLRADDPWLQVKTTERTLYDTVRAKLPGGADEVLFLNESGELCEGTITNLFVDLGEGLLTSPLTCGLLPGVLRAELLKTGRAREERLRPADLNRAKAIYVGNSLRGLIPARMIKI